MNKFVLALVALLSYETSQACSIQVNDAYQKNLLIAYAASEMGINLEKTFSMSATNYQLSFSGGSGGGSCPTHQHTEARVSLTYLKNKFTKCTMTVTVQRAEQIGETLAPGPFETIATALPASSCSLIFTPRVQ